MERPALLFTSCGLHQCSKHGSNCLIVRIGFKRKSGAESEEGKEWVKM